MKKLEKSNSKSLSPGPGTYQLPKHMGEEGPKKSMLEKV